MSSIAPSPTIHCLFSFQVKIWFQNKRSKYKKIMKNGPCGPEGDHLHPPPSASPCSPGMGPPLWEQPMASKGGAPSGHPGAGYMNTFGHWYPGHHQDSMPRTQMMWRALWTYGFGVPFLNLRLWIFSFLVPFLCSFLLMYFRAQWVVICRPICRYLLVHFILFVEARRFSAFSVYCNEFNRLRNIEGSICQNEMGYGSNIFFK